MIFHFALPGIKRRVAMLSVYSVTLFFSVAALSQAVESTQVSSQPLANQTSGIQPATPQHVAREEAALLLEQLGVLAAVRQAPQVAEMSLRGQLMTQPTSDALQQLQETILQQYAATEELQAGVIDFVAARIDTRALSRAKNLLEQSLPVSIRNSEKIMQQSSAVADMNEFHRKLGMQPSVNSRKELVAAVDKTLRISLLAVQIQTSVDQAINARLAAENHVQSAPQNLVVQKLAARESFMRQRVSDLLLFVYKDIRASELREYTVLMSDDSIQKLLDLSQQAIEISLRE